MIKNIIYMSAFVFAQLTTTAQNDTISAFSNSYAHEATKQYGNAISNLDKVYSEQSYPLNLRLGWLHYLNGDLLKSKAYYEKAIALKPKSIEARLGNAYPLAALENWDEVTANYEAILSIDELHPLTNYRLAYIAYYSSKNSEKAIVYLNKVLATNPFDYDANYLLATVQLSLGNIKEAKEAISVALQYNPNSTEAWSLYNSVK